MNAYVSVDYQDWRQWQTRVLYDGRQEREQYDAGNQDLLRHLS